MANKLISELCRGEWSSLTAYTIGDIVTLSGSSYICKDNNTNQTPPNTSYWSLLASKGTDGAKGDTGATGATGPTGPQGPKGADGVGTGDVVGPSSAVDSDIPLFDSTTGKLLKDSGYKISDLFSSNLLRQAIINGNFDIWQRGTTITLSNATPTYLADRWYMYSTNNGGVSPTITISRQSLTPGDILNSFYFLRWNTDGAGSSLGVNSYAQVRQYIENGVRYLCGSGKKITVSFYARSSIANKRLGVSVTQNYGTGGSPSSSEEIITQSPITLTSNWAKYSVTFDTNTIVEKTFGTNNDDSLQVKFSLMWGSTLGNSYVYPGVTAETFVGAGNVDIAQVQVYAGGNSLPFQPKSFEEELRACLRYFEKSFEYSVAPANNAGATGALISVCETTYQYQKVGMVHYKVPKRVLVTPTFYNPGAGTSGQASVDGAGQCPIVTVDYGQNGFYCYVNNSARVQGQTLRVHWSVDAEL